MNGRRGKTRLNGASRLAVARRLTAAQVVWQWERLVAEHDYFCAALTHLFEAAGYRVLDRRVHREPREEATHSCGFVLRRGDQQHIALGLRQDLIVTSDVVGRLGRVVQSQQAEAGLIVTTSSFTDAAVQAARRQPITLYDGHELWRLLNMG
jgi:hypothetical protein